MSTATARAYQPYFAGWFMPSEMRKSPQNRAFYEHRDTYSGKAHCIKWQNEFAEGERLCRL